ncbi:PREDICTED: alpha-(1,3)-fucosyltransferase B-like isoform X1 [Bactrocera latifrons]|uniref:alpha-(1,3)-fucosyltransferase B-like isoform X1 n=1 Tax=Bactrocera latifrons TaxID=174628 RepID=UPI0008DD7934|nr:PREDICTED: alpha-(1,3)-fucosyltransferase B-like isoform X1 [Bactrocera latifrons]
MKCSKLKYQLWNCKCRSCGKRFILYCCVLVAGALLLVRIFLHLYIWYQLPKRDKIDISEPRLLLWWTDYNEKVYYRNIYCGYFVCTITNDRQRLAEAKVIFFYGSYINAHDMPLPRHAYQLWALLQDETPQNAPYLFYQEFLRHFNYTSTFSRYSDYPLTLRSLHNPKELILRTYFRALRFRSSIPVLFMQDNCATLSGRENYVRELMTHVPVHSCGKCLRNADSPSFRRENDVLRFISGFKFVIAFEDAICDDYITAAYWQALIVGAIPIYFGSLTIRDWEPHNHSAIYASDFESPAALAELIYELVDNETAFLDYLQHKFNTEEPITNKRLLKALLWHFNLSKKAEHFEKFEKEMCTEINSRRDKPISKIANQTHFSCPLPQRLPATRKNYTKHAQQWKVNFTVSQRIVRLLDILFRRNAPNAPTQFTEKVKQLVGWDNL